MKKWIALLLTIALCLGLVACGEVEEETFGSSAASCEHSYKKATCTEPQVCKKCGKTKGRPLGHEYEDGVCAVCGAYDVPTAPTTSPNPSKPTTPTNPTMPPWSVGDPPHPDVLPQFRGKTLEIYGMGTGASYTDYSQFGKGNYLWMMRAAMEEWADTYGVTLVFKGSYNQAAILADMSSGGRPDLIFQAEKFPTLANVGIVAPFTTEEYNKLAAICGNNYLDMMLYNNSSVGVVCPWNGTKMCYYNKTMFENYGVKTPKEYFLEGNWTWETFMRCMEDMTKDVDADGTIDTYGLTGDSWGKLVNPYATDENGRLISVIDEPWMQDFIQLKYDAFVTKKVSVASKNNIQKNVIYPMFAMQISDCEHYNFEHLYQTIPNGDELEVVPVPAWRGNNGETLKSANITQYAMHLAATCDEREAAVDMMAYVLKCGMRYMSDFSLGGVKCSYPGIQGTCAVSANWRNAFAKVVADRAADIRDIDGYDEDYIEMMSEYLESCDMYTDGVYTNVTALTSFSEITQLPPASSIPAVKQKYQKMLDAYNSKYFK